MTTPASALIRASTEALPEHLRVPWRSFAEQVYVEHNGNDHVFAWASEPFRPQMPETAAHIALLASPDVATALADLLDALHTALREGREGARLDYFAEWRALEYAINGSDEPFATALEQAITKGGRAAANRARKRSGEDRP